MAKEDMAEVEVTYEDTEDIGATGDGKSAVATPDGKKQERTIICCNCVLLLNIQKFLVMTFHIKIL